MQVRKSERSLNHRPVALTQRKSETHPPLAMRRMGSALRECRIFKQRAQAQQPRYRMVSSRRILPP